LVPVLLLLRAGITGIGVRIWKKALPGFLTAARGCEGRDFPERAKVPFVDLAEEDGAVRSSMESHG
jgi:hypothetical protein